MATIWYWSIGVFKANLIVNKEDIKSNSNQLYGYNLYIRHYTASHIVWFPMYRPDPASTYNC